ncbi:hypothetical protein [Kovacikia minuta]|nr:hypothetical protein [Kovacikia minuta]
MSIMVIAPSSESAIATANFLERFVIISCLSQLVNAALAVPQK